MPKDDATSKRSAFIWTAIGFAAYLLWSMHALILLDCTDHYNFTPWVGCGFVVALLAMVALRRAAGFEMTEHRAIWVYVLAALFGVVYLLFQIEPSHLTVLIAWQALSAIAAFYWARRFAQLKVMQTIRVVSTSGCIASALLGIDLVSQNACTVACICMLVLGIVSMRMLAKDSASPADAHDAETRTWPLTLVILICTLCSTAFAGMMFNPYLINSHDHYALHALVGLVFCTVLGIWALRAKQANITGFMLAGLILLELSMLALATGFTGDVATPLSAINASDYILYLIMFILMAMLSRSSTTRLDYFGTYAIGLLLASGITGRLAGFALAQTVDPPYVSMKTLAAVLLAAFAALYLIFSVAELFSQRTGFQRESAQRVAQVQQAAEKKAREAQEQAERQAQEAIDLAQSEVLHSIHDFSREEAVERIAQQYELTERETEALELLSQGLQRRDIAESWVVSENTVKFHMRNLFRKLDVHSAQEAIALVDQVAIKLLKSTGA